MRFVVAVPAAGVALALAAPGFASHKHWLQTPGHCNPDIAKGQTAKEEDEPGGHKFHENVHTGTPGTFAFERENNPVSVGKEPAPC